MPCLAHLPFAALLSAVLLAACSGGPSPERLDEGTWTGGLTPMIHPEMVNPIIYKVRRDGDELAIDVVGPGGEVIPTRDIRYAGDSLFFTFNEPEDGVTLSCSLAREEVGFAGRCSDSSGKWAHFTMHPPAE